jgi:hypothetical protein
VLSPMAQKKLDGRLLRMRALVTMKRSLGETRQTRSKMQLEGVRAQQDIRAVSTSPHSLSSITTVEPIEIPQMTGPNGECVST